MKNLRIIIFAAHSDDETIGAGASIAKFTEEGHQVISVIMSSGTGSSPWLKEDVLIETREAEAKKIANYLGVQETILLGLQDGKLPEEIENPKVLETVKKIIERYKPDRIYTHSKYDPHPDHKATNKITLKAITQIDKEEKIGVYIFEVWNIINELQPRVYEDVSKTFWKKIKAMKMFTSQWLFVYLLLIPVILRAKIAGFHAKCKYAERFYKIR